MRQTLTDSFFCYVRPNPHGFFGELRDMVRYDMTVGQAIPFHVKTWNFEDDNPARKLHEFAHQPLSIGSIYIPELHRYRIQADPQTGFLKPQGYNGFMEGEMIAIGIQNVIEALLIGEPITDWQSELEEGVRRAYNHYGHIIGKNDLYFWVTASEQDTPQSLFEAKFNEKFVLYPPTLPLFRPDFTKANRHGEMLVEYKRPTSEELEAVANKMSPLFQFIADSFKERNIVSPVKAAKFLYGLKVRDLHVLIGGEDAANAYFRKCGVDINTPATFKGLKR